MTKLWVILLLWVGVILSAGCTSSTDESETQTVDAPQDGEEVVEEVEEIIEDGGNDGYEIVEESAGLPEEVTTTQQPSPKPKAQDRQSYMEPGSSPPPAAPAVEEEEIAEEPESAPMNADSYAKPETPMEPDNYAMDPGGDEVAMPEDAKSEVEPKSKIPTEKPVKEVVTKSYVPVKKIAETPWKQGGVPVNAVYLVRPGDTMDSISEKIYGNSSRADEMYDINPGLKRGMKVGDKVYYNSPIRPTDVASLLTFYEDNGVSAETYTAKSGDNIRKVSQNLLGHPRSWMEVWSTNPDVESKWELSPGTELKYWPANIAMGGPAEPDQSQQPMAKKESSNPYQDVDDDDAAAPVAASEPPPPPKGKSSEALPPAMDDSADSYPSDSMNDMPPPPIDSGDSQDAAELGPDMNPSSGELGTTPPPVEPMGTPSLPDEAVAPPPPPPPPKPAMKKPRAQQDGGGLDAFLADEFNLMLAAGVLFIVVAGALVVIRKKRQSRRINLGETQV